MHINVKVLSDYFAIETDENETIQCLAEEAIKRSDQIFGGKKPQSPVCKVEAGEARRDVRSTFIIRRQTDSAVLSPRDKIGMVLENGEHIVLDFEGIGTFLNSAFTCCPGKEDSTFCQDISCKEFIYLDGESLTPEDLVKLGQGHYRIALTKESIKRVEAARKVVEDVIARGKITYGVNTGFGMFANTVIPNEKLTQLQFSLIRSHAAGVGDPVGLQATRMLFALRINVLSKGYSGISLDTLEKMIKIYNASCLPWIPEKGSVGASGDLAPLAHLALGLIGEGEMWSPLTGWTTAKNALVSNNLVPLDLKPKEGLCLINGTQLITSIGARALVRSTLLALQADVVAALTLDVSRGTTAAYDADVARVRPHNGQNEVAKRLRSLLNSERYPSEIAGSHKNCSKVQDCYTLRCIPQVHGITWDTIDFVRKVITTEINSATDNPLVFPDRDLIVSAGNFHGEYPGKVLDYLTIAVHELACMSERRIERLINPAYSGLPAFLTKNGGLNSGFMIAHVTAAALTSENKVLCHPSTVDSLPTSSGQEDHVSMGAFAARKCLEVVKNVERVLAIELLAAAQTLEFLRPLKTTAPLEALHRLVRSVSPAWEEDRYMAPDIESVTKLIREGQVWETVRPYLESPVVAETQK
ncbi:unnamed protein product [Calicophoron daubneyi]|uniref:Histidine ammonia-lyase n=1 Tax=Calicophoron daubneyi TaxID=300641 RepID=A0AAV2TMH7_CALDB